MNPRRNNLWKLVGALACCVWGWQGMAADAARAVHQARWEWFGFWVLVLAAGVVTLCRMLTSAD